MHVIFLVIYGEYHRIVSGRAGPAGSAARIPGNLSIPRPAPARVVRFNRQITPTAGRTGRAAPLSERPPNSGRAWIARRLPPYCGTEVFTVIVPALRTMPGMRKASTIHQMPTIVRRPRPTMKTVRK